MKAAAAVAAVLAISCGEARLPAPRPSPQAAAPRPLVLAAEPSVFDFGRVLPGRSVRKEFRLRNLGRQEIAIESVTTDCGCLVAGEYARRLPPGGSTSLTVMLQVPAEPGRVERTVVVRTGGPAAESLALRLRATVVADVKEEGG